MRDQNISKRFRDKSKEKMPRPKVDKNYTNERQNTKHALKYMDVEDWEQYEEYLLEE